MFWTVPPSKSRILGLKTQILEPGKKNIIVGLRLFPMRFDFELQICVFSISKTMTLLMQPKHAKPTGIFSI